MLFSEYMVQTRDSAIAVITQHYSSPSDINSDELRSILEQDQSIMEPDVIKRKSYSDLSLEVLDLLADKNFQFELKRNNDCDVDFLFDLIGQGVREIDSLARTYALKNLNLDELVAKVFA